MITDTANTLILNAVIAKSIDNIDVLSLKNATGEYFRKAYTKKETINDTERKYTFYLTENDGNDTIVGMSLYGDGANETLGTGKVLVTQVVNIPKTNTTSLLVQWTVKVVS